MNRRREVRYLEVRSCWPGLCAEIWATEAQNITLVRAAGQLELRCAEGSVSALRAMCSFAQEQLPTGSLSMLDARIFGERIADKGSEKLDGK